MNRSPNPVFWIASISVGLFAALPAHAASAVKVATSEWGVSGLPSYVNMYIYVPDKLATKPAILVASHHCQGTGLGTFDETKSSLVPLADKNGFIMIFPEATGHNCWDVGSAKALKHDGGGDTHAIAQMVRYTLTKYNADASRVYAFGGSSGAMMTQALLGIYPDIFMAGVAISGVPCGCWAESYSGDSGANPQWSGPCAGGQVSKTGKQWGDLVRSMFPGYSGHRPRVQLWHGSADTTISPNNMAEAIKEWTNVLALSETPSNTDTKFNAQHQTWKSSCGYTVLETFSVQGAGHGVNWDVNTAASFLGLDKASGPDPEAAACPGTGGSSGTGGSIGAGGSVSTAGSGGVATAGGAGGRGGDTAGNGGQLSATGGRGGGASSGSGNGGTATSAGGSSATGGTNGGTDKGGTGTSGGTVNTAGGTGTATGGALAQGGIFATGGAPGVNSGGTPATGGSVGASSGGVRVSGGTNGQSGGPTAGGDPSPEGCGCIVVGSHTRHPGSAAAVLLGMLGLVFRRRRRPLDEAQ